MDMDEYMDIFLNTDTTNEAVIHDDTAISQGVLTIMMTLVKQKY